jgi:predicted TIM-barrel fold metal-dependent hydrolase
MMKVGPFNHLGAKKRPYLDLLPLVERVIDAFGPERCMWESDSPALRPGNYDVDPAADFEACLALIRDHAGFLSPSDKDQVLFKTAEDFFFRR